MSSEVIAASADAGTNQAAKPGDGGSEGSERGINMTQRAIDHRKKEMRKVEGAVGFRVGVTKTGCSGLAYVVDFVHEPDATDMVFPMDDELTVYVDPKSFETIRGTEVDFVREGLSMLIRFRNPNVRSECGCGESFNV